MTTVLVVGAGSTGARAARQSVAAGHEVVLVDVDRSTVERVAEALGPSASPGTIDARADAAVLALPRGAHVAAATSLLRRGVPVVSTADAVDDVRGLLDLDAEARERGVAVVAGAGLSPGLSCLLVRHAAATLDDVTEIRVGRAGVAGPACADSRRHALALGGRDRLGGTWVHRRGGPPDLWWFPDPLGMQRCRPAAGASAVLLARAFPGADDIVTRVAAGDAEVLTARLPLRMRRPPADGGPGGVRVEVHGRRGAEHVVVTYGALELPGPAAGAVAAVAVDAVLEGTLGPGAHGLAEVADPLPLLRRLAELGIRAATTAPAPEP